MQALSDEVLVQVLCQLARCSGADSCAALGRASLVCRQWRRAASAAPRLPWSCALFRTADTRTRPPPRWFCGSVRAVECSPLPVWSARAIKVTGTLAAPAERPARRRQQQPGEGGQREGEGQHEHEHEHEALVAAGYGANLEAIEVDPLVTPDEAVDAFVAEHVALCPRLAALRCPFGPRTLAALAARPASWARVAAIEGWPALEALPAPGTAQCRVLDGALAGVSAWGRDVFREGCMLDEALGRWGPQLRTLELESFIADDRGSLAILRKHASKLARLRRLVLVYKSVLRAGLVAFVRALPCARSLRCLRIRSSGSCSAEALACFSGLEELSIDHAGPEVLRVVRGLAGQLRSLEVVYDSYAGVSEAELYECVGSCAVLEKLALFRCPAHAAPLQRCLERLPVLSKLTLSEYEAALDVYVEQTPDPSNREAFQWAEEVFRMLASTTHVVPQLSRLRILFPSMRNGLDVLRASRPWLRVLPCGNPSPHP
eukprot:m51a1_g1493 hypothetical protein (489) ;mRNA; f:322889-324355